MPPILCLIALLVLCFPKAGLAGSAALFGSDSFPGQRAALLTPAHPVATSPRASLFAGTQGQSLFARTRRDTAVKVASPPPLRGTPVERLRHLIGQAESVRHGYDAVQHGARIRPGKRPTDMTVSEILGWIRDTPGQPHAIGRYQFIPATLRRLIRQTATPVTARFTPKLQDQLADVLLAEAGFHQMRTGKMTRHGFMNNLAKIWAGLPDNSGKSYYHGYAGNRASMTWARFDAEMARIFPG